MSVCASPVLRQYLVIITANLSFITLGLNVAWASPVLVKLKDENQTVLSRPITDEEGSWIVSIGPLFGLFLTFIIGDLMDRIGRKTCIVLGCIPRLTMYFMAMFATEVWLLCLARAIDGLANSFVISVVPTYASEIAGIGLGTFFKLKQEEFQISGFLNFLPLLSMILVIFCFNAGIGSIFWTVVAELFDGPARAIGVSTGIGIATLFVFLTTKYFAYVTNAIGSSNTYWIFSVNCVITALFMMFYIPETRGKTFAEIQEDLGRRNVKTSL